MSRRRKKKDSPIKTVFLIIMAAITMIAAMYTIMSVVGKIRSDYKSLDFTTEEREVPSITTDTKDEPKDGWNETDKGWMYYLDEKEYVIDQRKDIEGFLYYFDSGGIMTTGELKQEGQTYTCHDTKGYLKNIQIGPDYVPENTGENLDSLVGANTFRCYLRAEDIGLFKTILYRKIVENKVAVLEGETALEKTTGNSMRAYGDYVYFLPKVKESQKQSLSEAERGFCNKLFRMRPGSDTKELIAKNVDGYMILGGITYYSQGGKIYQTTLGAEVATGGARYLAVIKDGNCYLVDDMGNPAVAKSGSSVSIGDRVYRIEEDGKIKYTKYGQVTADGKTYYLGGSGTKSSVYVKRDGSDTAVIGENYGVQSYCIVDNQIYYSNYVDKGTGGEWYSQIFEAGLNGQNKQAVPERFPGVMQNMYYYEDEGQIFGEYNPAIWKQVYGTVVMIAGDGGIYQTEDTSARTGKHVDGNGMLEIIMAGDGKVICLWYDYQWERNSGIIGILWSKAIELNAGGRRLIDVVLSTEPVKSSEAQETGDIIQPIEAMSPASTETVSPVEPFINNDLVISTEGPHTDTVVPTAPVLAPTVPLVTEPSAEAKIMPLG